MVVDFGGLKGVLTCSRRRTVGAGGSCLTPDFGRSDYYPISTGGSRLWPPHYYLPPGFSDFPMALRKEGREECCFHFFLDISSVGTQKVKVNIMDSINNSNNMCRNLSKVVHGFSFAQIQNGQILGAKNFKCDLRIALWCRSTVQRIRTKIICKI